MVLAEDLQRTHQMNDAPMTIAELNQKPHALVAVCSELEERVFYTPKKHDAAYEYMTQGLALAASALARDAAPPR